ncbi:MAG TPA: hypothetical protein VK679_02235 [Gemmatimonadaceae bacterium]|nr:hypothetical protein [Gemmatimonadaceae bacterium]
MRISIVATALLLGGCAYYEQTYMPAPHNWAFRHKYPTADRLFNAFDYGHAIVYEELIAHPNGPVSRIEDDRFNFIVDHLLVHPPAVPLDEEAVGPRYAQLLPEAHEMFEWAHMLHRQIYDIWADDDIPPAAKDSAVATVIRYYRSRGDLAFSATPKSMSLMDGQFYSKAFRKTYPKFTGLLWSYHWMQIVLYDALMRGTSPAQRQANVDTVVRRFRAMLEDPPAHMPSVMPMTATIAPEFAERYPEAAIIFDNLHSFHDVVADILASPDVPASRKRAEVLAAAARYRDGTSSVTSVADWRQMSTMMGAAQMGGVPW